MVEVTNLFEVAWEVCNKVGGIYTVVKSKIPHIKKVYGDNYFVVGPYIASRSMKEFSAKIPPPEFKEVFEILKGEGIVVYYGEWVAKDRPRAILLDVSGYHYLDQIKGRLWERFKIDSLDAPADFDEPVLWASAVGRVIELMVPKLQGKTCVQVHEWLSGAALLYLKDKEVDVGTVFTTHATVLGRTLAGRNFDLYCSDKNNTCVLETMDLDKAAYEFGVHTKHQLERATAQESDVFSTVSEVTGLEAEFMLKRKPDQILPNGLDFTHLPNLEEIPIKHDIYRDRIREFTLSYFAPYYPIDVENTLFYFLSGRYEFRNKGIDVTIKALARLNSDLKKDKSKRQVVCFLFVPGDIRGINLSVIENKTLFDSMKHQVEENLANINEQILYGLGKGKMPNEAQIFSEDFVQTLKRDMDSLKKEGLPPMCTHQLGSEDDAILNALWQEGLDNREDNPVKVILYPCYLGTSDGLLDLPYYSAIWGCHFGIFPSYYEPWGYTPVECAAHGVPALTSDLSGFGKFLMSQDVEDPGVSVVERLGKTDQEVVDAIADKLLWYSLLSRKERIEYKVKAEHFAPRVAWGKLVVHYFQAHKKAVDNGTS